MATEFWSLPPARKLIATGVGAVLLAFCGALGGSVFTAGSSWFGGVATNGELDQAISPVAADAQSAKAECARLAKMIGEPTPVESRETLAERMTASATTDLQHDQRIGLAVRERVGYQVALHVGMDPKRREAAQDARIAALAKYDELVLRYSPEAAADKVLQQARVPR